jgi:hypothetical protein
MPDDEDDLAPLFAAARAARPVPSADLTARVLADARALQPTPAAARRPLAGLRQALAEMFASLGGAGAVAGLGTAAVAGVLIGYASPAASDWISNALAPAGSSIELLSTEGPFLTEG